MNGAIIVNAFYKTGFCVLIESDLVLIGLLFPVNRHTPSFPVELSKGTYETCTDSFTEYIE